MASSLDTRTGWWLCGHPLPLGLRVRLSPSPATHGEGAGTGGDMKLALRQQALRPPIATITLYSWIFCLSHGRELSKQG